MYWSFCLFKNEKLKEKLYLVNSKYHIVINLLKICSFIGLNLFYREKQI